MGESDRRARRKASLRREILTAASNLFVEEGVDAVTMRKVAARIDYSATTIYLHFKDKRELFAAVCDEAFRQLAGKFDRLQRTPASPLEHLREGLRTYIEFGLSHQDHYAATFLSPGGRADAGPAAESVGRTVLDAFARLVAAGVEQGSVRTADPAATAQTLWAGVHGVTALLISMKGLPLRPQKALIERMVGTLIAGLEAPPAAPPAEPEPPPVPRPAARRVPSRDFSFMD